MNRTRRSTDCASINFPYLKFCYFSRFSAISCSPSFAGSRKWTSGQKISSPTSKTSQWQSSFLTIATNNWRTSSKQEWKFTIRFYILLDKNRSNGITWWHKKSTENRVVAKVARIQMKSQWNSENQWSKKSRKTINRRIKSLKKLKRSWVGQPLKLSTMRSKNNTL